MKIRDFDELIEYGEKAKYFLKKNSPTELQVTLYIPIELKPTDRSKVILAMGSEEKKTKK